MEQNPYEAPRHEQMLPVRKDSRLTAALVIFAIEAIPIPLMCLPGLVFALISPGLLWPFRLANVEVWGAILYPAIWALSMLVAFKLSKNGKAALWLTALPPIALLPFVVSLPKVL